MVERTELTCRFGPGVPGTWRVQRLRRYRVGWREYWRSCWFGPACSPCNRLPGPRHWAIPVRVVRCARKPCAIPLSQLSPEAQQRIAAVVNKPSVYRCLPVKVIDCDPSLYLFLVRNPEVVVNIWELMGATQIQLDRTGPFTFCATDGLGTQSTVELVYGTHDTHLVYGEGVYEGPLTAPADSGPLCVVSPVGIRTHGARARTRNKPAGRIPAVGPGRGGRGGQDDPPAAGCTADLNFTQTVDFVERISQTAEANGEGMQRLAARLTRVDEPIRQQFAALTAAVDDKSRQRLAAHSPAVTLQQAQAQTQVSTLEAN